MTDDEWDKLNTACHNLVNHFFRRVGLAYSQEQKDDIAQDVLSKCAEYIILKGVKPKGNLVNFAYVYGFKPVQYSNKKIFNDKILSMDVWETFDETTVDEMLRDAVWEDGIIKLRNAQ